ncbi:MAG: cyanophycinase [Anaerolineales bacterium]
MTTLMAIGGAINPKKPTVLEEFIRRAGGDLARVVILPQASALKDTGQYYEAVFRTLGAEDALALEFHQRGEAGAPKQLEAIRGATGIFIAGGNQMRLSVSFGGTPLEAELLSAYRRGCVIAGTSAGAAILSKTMIAYGKNGPTPREGILHFAPGLGFTEKFTFDQHFRQRDRLGRLVYAVATHPGILGVGVDEDTAAIVENDEAITVCGSGAVTIVDGQEITGTDVAEIERRGPIAVSNLKVHILTDTCVYNGRTRQVRLPQKTLLVE